MKTERNEPCPCGSGKKHKHCCGAKPQSGGAQQLLAAGTSHHRAGRIAEAAASYREVLVRDPDQVDALHLLGVAERDLGRCDEAVALLERTVALRPGFAAAHGNLGMVLAEAGRLGEAVLAYERALELEPGLAATWFNLGNALRDGGESEAAIICYREAVARSPFPEFHRNLAQILAKEGRSEEAVASYRKAIATGANDADVWQELGLAEYALGHHAEALTSYYRASQLRPDFAEAHSNLGVVLQDLGRIDEAVHCFRRALELAPGLVTAWNNLGSALQCRGEVREAYRCFCEALILKPDFAEAELNLGNIFKLSGDLEQAKRCFSRALELKPALPEAYNNLAVVLTEQGHHAEAIGHLQAAIRERPHFAEAYNNLGNVYKNQGRLEVATESFRRALEIRPDYAAAHSNLLFTLAFVDGMSQQEIFDRHRDFNVRHAAHLAPGVPSHANERDPNRRLKIGYLSPDFRAHACAFFVEPLFRHHHREAVEVHAYAEVPFPDAVTAKLRPSCDHWHSTVGMSDEALDAQIRADGIDILVDLAGHTANSRLLVLARKPAPLQVAYLGYPATTGLDTVDYRLTDARAEPPGQSERYYTEDLLRLPNTLWCYQPLADMPDVGPLPALERGHVRFVSLNYFAKIGPRVVDLWADVLRAVPDAELEMITVPAGATQDRVRADFAARGVNPGRVLLHDRLLRRDYLELFSRVDIALDPFPCNGGTTTCDALWMGLPVVALIGETFLSRASYSVLHAAGMPEFAVSGAAEYVRLAAALAADLPGLAARRAGMRARVASSALTDAESFARDLEGVYRDIWRHWCASD
ncbi:MAG: tetratricopeptide repeat protein [Gammaproteobacteria bacterium]|nr:tetratricopeptide repeat protein [Gammaproteobacteria bacterium]